MGLLKKSTPKKTESKIIPDDKDGTLPFIERQNAEHINEEITFLESGEAEPKEEDGQLALDVFQTTEEIVVVAPIAGVSSDDLSINITDEVLTISGRRNFQFKLNSSDYFTQECFWGSFSRSIILPESVDTASIKASFKNGILTVRIPKIEKIRSRTVKIKEE